jgi:hypothetical protein
VAVVGVYSSHAFSNVNVQIPDTVSAVALARSGYYNAAMAGAIGSQVPNTTACTYCALRRCVVKDISVVAGRGQFRQLLETDVPYGAVQVINVSLGVGVPALLVCLFGDGNLRISQPETARYVQLQRPLSVGVALLVLLLPSYAV